MAELSSNIVSTFQAGAFFGCIIGFFFAERLGRRPVIMLSMLVFNVGVIMQLIGKLGLLCKSKLFIGRSVRWETDAMYRRWSSLDWSGHWRLFRHDPDLHCRV